MLAADSASFTYLFQQWRNGDAAAGDYLFQMIYFDLLRLAQSYVSRERGEQAIEAPSLVNRAYLRLFHEEKIDVECRAHFFVIAARQMRRILIDLSRRKQRSPEVARPVLTELEDMIEDKILMQPFQIDVLALDEALNELEEISERACRAVELRFFAGLTEVEAAEALGISLATFKRDWTFAKRWLYTRLQ